jgi:hypothetical protein
MFFVFLLPQIRKVINYPLYTDVYNVQKKIFYERITGIGR